MAKRCFILDNGLFIAAGHWASFDRMLSLEFGSRGISPILLVPRRCDDSVLSGLVSGKLFSVTPNEVLSSDPLIGSFESFLRHAEMVEHDLSTLPSDFLAPGDILVPIVNDAAFLMGYVRWWLARPPESRFPTVFLFTMPSGVKSIDPLVLSDHPYWSEMARFFRFAGNRMRDVDLRGLTFLGPELTAPEFAFLLEQPINPMPCNFRIDFARVDPVARAFDQSGAAPVAGFFGGTRSQKGFHLLPDTVLLLLDRHPTLRFVLQVAMEESTPEISTAVGRLIEIAQREPRVDLLSRMDTDTYYDTMAKTDFVLQPYDPTTYASSPSGVFCEATLLGRASVAPRGTTMARYIEALEGFGAVHEGWDPEAIADACLTLAKRVGELRARAPEIRQTWRSRHGTKQLVDLILERAAS